MRLGIVVNEFFHEDLGGFGGYGFLVKSITKHFSSCDDNAIIARVFLTIRRNRCVQRYHGTDVVFPPVSTMGLLGKSCHRLKYRKQLLWPDVFITIEFLEKHLAILSRTGRTPTIIWFQDPRDKSEWQKIESVRLECEHSGLSDTGRIAEMRRELLEEFIQQSEEKGRPVLFAAQAFDLIGRAKRLYTSDRVSDKIDRAFLLPNPVTMPKQEVRFSEKASKPMVLFLGRLDPIKRPWLFCEIAKRIPEVDFVVAGKAHKPEIMDPVLSPYVNLPNLKFLGLITGDDKAALLRQSWILVNTSIHEALPVSWLEALAHKIPIISCVDVDEYATRFGSFVGEYLGDGYEAVLPFQEALQFLLTDKSKRHHLGELGFEHVSMQHTYLAFENSLLSNLNPLN